MFNPVIIVALVIQSLIARTSRIAGAVVGYLITTGILIWSLSLYAKGDAIAFFSIPFSQPVFIVACLIWYGFDTKELVAAQKATSAVGDTCQPLALTVEGSMGNRTDG